jgi:hypothetical protein
MEIINMDDPNQLLTDKIKMMIGEYIFTILQLQIENQILAEKLENLQKLFNK